VNGGDPLQDRFAIKKCLNQKLKALFQGRVTETRHTCVISGYKKH